MSFSNREIDLVADSKNYQVKRQKLDRLALQKKELEAAIAALKKPNRSTVAGAFMDEVEQRKAQMSAQVVHITATPRARRTKDRELFEPELPPVPIAITTGFRESMVPSSTIKPRFGKPTSSSIPRASATKRAVLSAIHETPSRGLERKTSNPLALPQDPRALSVADQVTTITVTPAPPRSRMHLDSNDDAPLAPPQFSDMDFSSSQNQSPSRDKLRMSRSLRPVLFTPLKRSEVSIEDAFRDAPEIPEKAGKMMDRVMGGRGLEMDLDLNQEVQLSSSPPGTVPNAIIDDEEARDEGNRARHVQQTMPEKDEGDIYAQLGWNDDFDL